MSDLYLHLPNLLLAYGAYLVATVSPGPSNMAIMGTAMSWGRLAALALSAGVLCGSLTWALLAALGISALLATYALALSALKFIGGFYLLFLAYKSARAAMRAAAPVQAAAAAPLPPRELFVRGLLMHLTNPKAILAWIAIISLSLPVSAPVSVTAAIILGCACMGVLVFGGYALLFSSLPMIRAYQKARRWIEGVFALFFGVAGIRLLTSRI